MSRRRFRVSVYGCRVNQYEAQLLRENFAAAGWQAADDGKPADCTVICTCAVTARAEAEGRRAVRRAAAAGGRVIMSGCLARDTAGAPGGDTPPGVERKTTRRLLDEFTAPREAISRFDQRQRAFVKVADGCDRHCAYCLVSRLRGPLRSRPPGQVRAELAALVAGGWRTAVLCGINLGCYGRDRGSSLAALLASLAAAPALPADLVLELSSLEPDCLTPELVDRFAADRRLAPRLHLPLQSGADRILGAMGRPYRAADYLALTARARRHIPGLRLSSDLMVGFPGESEADFQATVDLARACAFDRVHIFRFSPRPGTPAATMGGQVAAATKRERAQRLRAALAPAAVGPPGGKNKR